jgi:hypothetical protein
MICDAGFAGSVLGAAARGPALNFGTKYLRQKPIMPNRQKT